MVDRRKKRVILCRTFFVGEVKVPNTGSGVMAMAAESSKLKNSRSTEKKESLKKTAPAKTPHSRPAGLTEKVPKPPVKTEIKSPVPITPRKVTMQPSPSGLKISKQERDRLKQVLVDMKHRLAGQVTSLKTDALTRDDGVHSAEDGTDAFERQFALSIASSENKDLVEIEEAIRRLDEGSYGACEECGCVIGEPRLKALPFVRKCVSCQSKTESSRAHSRAPATMDPS